MNTKKDKIIEVFKEIHGDRVPMFRWIEYPYMRYWFNYNECSIDCECGINININLSEEEVNYNNVINIIYELEDKIRTEYKKYNIYLYYDD